MLLAEGCGRWPADAVPPPPRMLHALNMNAGCARLKVDCRLFVQGHDCCPYDALRAKLVAGL